MELSALRLTYRLVECPTFALRIAPMSEPAETRDPRLTFGTVVDVYDEIRPTYPEALFDEFFALLASQPVILEVGPGTGQATRDLLARGAVVHAVEISPSMAGRLRSNLPTERLTVSVGDFETIDLAAESVDAIFSASAYHWISPAAQLDRPATILRSGGVLAIVGLFQVDSPEDRGFFAAVQPIYERYGQAHDDPPAPARPDVEPTIAQALAGDARFCDVEVHRWDWDQTYTASEFRKLMLSFSDTNMMDASDRTGLVDDMEAFINSDFDGRVTRPLVVTLTTARRAGAATGRAGTRPSQTAATAESGVTGVTSPVGWTRKIQTSQVTWLTTRAPKGHARRVERAPVGAGDPRRAEQGEVAGHDMDPAVGRGRERRPRPAAVPRHQRLLDQAAPEELLGRSDDGRQPGRDLLLGRIVRSV